VLALLAALALQSSAAAPPQSLRHAAERWVQQSPNDSRAHLALGRVWLAWPVVGRYQALAEFRTAARLAPADPEPLYDVMRTGFRLGSDEGEVIARDALLGMFALDPDYRDSWARFQEVYRNAAVWRRADRALARHPASAIALERRATIALSLAEPARAESLAALAQAMRGPTTALYLVRSDAAFLAGNDARGQALHDSAIAVADQDSTGALWSRARLVAAPEEVERYELLGADQQRAFFMAFWSVRDPNLLTSGNERLGEQTRRVSEARRQFQLLHPQRMLYHSADYRALLWFEEPGAVRWLLDTAATLAFQAGLDARGLMFVRHGKPEARLACTPDPLVASADPACISSLDGEGWLYHTPAGVTSVGFRAGEYFAPASWRQLRGIATLLQTDRTALPAPLDLRATAAFFRAATPGTTDVYYRAAGDTAALVLWNPDGAEAGRAAGRGLLGVSVPAGAYRVGLDVDSAGWLGRSRGDVAVPWFDPAALELSSLVLGTDSAAYQRRDVLRAMPPALNFTGGTALVAYAEVYGLAAAPDGRVRYRARYTFAPERSLVGRVLHGTDPVSFEFERELPGGTPVAERLVLEPGRVAPGRYRVTLAVTDQTRNVKSETAAIVVTIH
jgi:hypothetical protein